MSQLHTPSTHGPNSPVFPKYRSSASDSESRGRRPSKRGLRRKYVRAVRRFEELDPAAASAIRRYVGRLREDEGSTRARLHELQNGSEQ